MKEQTSWKYVQCGSRSVWWGWRDRPTWRSE